MLQELSHMDRITQLQDEIEQVRTFFNNCVYITFFLNAPPAFTFHKLLVIMSSSIAYLTSKANFRQTSEQIPITKQRNPDKVDSPDVFEGIS